jgi:hypothetical protein
MTGKSHFEWLSGKNAKYRTRSGIIAVNVRGDIRGSGSAVESQLGNGLLPPNQKRRA